MRGCVLLSRVSVGIRASTCCCVRVFARLHACKCACVCASRCACAERHSPKWAGVPYSYAAGLVCVCLSVCLCLSSSSLPHTKPKINSVCLFTQAAWVSGAQNLCGTFIGAQLDSALPLRKFIGHNTQDQRPDTAPMLLTTHSASTQPTRTTPLCTPHCPRSSRSRATQQQKQSGSGIRRFNTHLSSTPTTPSVRTAARRTDRYAVEVRVCACVFVGIHIGIHSHWCACVLE